jgi:hypothetical protein
MSDSADDPIVKTLTQVQSILVEHANRVLACEALLFSMLNRIDPAALPGLAEQYDAAILRGAEQMPPSLQRPEIWDRFAGEIEDMREIKGKGARPSDSQ